METEQTKSEVTEKDKGEVAKDVTLSAEQYSGLLDRLAELEAMASKTSYRRSNEVVDIDELADEVKPARRTTTTEETRDVNLDELSNTQLVHFIIEQVNEKGKALATEVQTLKVLREIDKCESKYDDFWDLEKEIYAISTKNPTLSIDDAYKLAKSGKTEKVASKSKDKGGEEGERETVTQKMLKLPPRVHSGEKPGIAASVMKSGETKTLKDAAQKAWDEVVGKDKNVI